MKLEKGAKKSLQRIISAVLYKNRLQSANRAKQTSQRPCPGHRGAGERPRRPSRPSFAGETAQNARILTPRANTATFSRIPCGRGPFLVNTLQTPQKIAHAPEATGLRAPLKSADGKLRLRAVKIGTAQTPGHRALKLPCSTHAAARPKNDHVRGRPAKTK